MQCHRLQSWTTKIEHTHAIRVSLITHCTLCHYYIRISNALRWDFFDDAISITQHCHLSDNSLSICSSVQSAEDPVRIQETLVCGVSQKKQKSEFCFATNLTGFHRLDEPPEKISPL